jgi:hypothetical protein
MDYARTGPVFFPTPVQFLRNAAARSHIKAAQQELQRSDTSSQE